MFKSNKQVTKKKNKTIISNNKIVMIIFNKRKVCEKIYY